MSEICNGELIPLGGGDAISLRRPVLTVGRRDTCDIRLRFGNVSGLHCELTFQDGYWMVRDLGSTNGTWVNGVLVRKKVLLPKDTVAIAGHPFTIEYEPTGVGRLEEIQQDQEDLDDILSQPLLERAGLVRPTRYLESGRPSRKPGPAKDDSQEPSPSGGRSHSVAGLWGRLKQHLGSGGRDEQR